MKWKKRFPSYNWIDYEQKRQLSNSNLLTRKRTKSSPKNSGCGRPSLHSFFGSLQLCSCFGGWGCPLCLSSAAVRSVQPEILGFDFLVALFLQPRRLFHQVKVTEHGVRKSVPCSRFCLVVNKQWKPLNRRNLLCIIYVSHILHFGNCKSRLEDFCKSTSRSVGVFSCGRKPKLRFPIHLVQWSKQINATSSKIDISQKI